MAQEQLTCGFSESLLQLDKDTYIRIHNRQEPEIEFIVSGRKLSLTKKQWEKIEYLSTNIQLAFALLGESGIPTFQEEKRKKQRKEKIDDTFNEIVEALNL